MYIHYIGKQIKSFASTLSIEKHLLHPSTKSFLTCHPNPFLLQLSLPLLVSLNRYGPDPNGQQTNEREWLMPRKERLPVARASRRLASRCLFYALARLARLFTHWPPAQTRPQRQSQFKTSAVAMPKFFAPVTTDLRRATA